MGSEMCIRDRLGKWGVRAIKNGGVIRERFGPGVGSLVAGYLLSVNKIYYLNTMFFCVYGSTSFFSKMYTGSPYTQVHNI